MRIGQANLLNSGDEILVIGIGPILGEALKASQNLKENGINLAVASMGSLRPLDIEFLEKAKQKFKIWITLEEHGIIGGLGSSILEWISERQYNRDIKLYRLAAPTKFINELGDQSFIRSKLKIDAEGITNFLLEL